MSKLRDKQIRGLADRTKLEAAKKYISPYKITVRDFSEEKTSFSNRPLFGGKAFILADKDGVNFLATGQDVIDLLPETNFDEIIDLTIGMETIEYKHIKKQCRINIVNSSSDIMIVE